MVDFSYSDEQKMLQESVSRFVTRDYDFESRCKIVASDKGYSEANWQTFADLGWLMVPFKEEFGGLGGSVVDIMAVMEEFGKGMVVEPFLTTAIMGGNLLTHIADQDKRQELIDSLISGELQLAFAYAEPKSRYNLSNVTCSAVRDGDDYVINGHKSVVFNGSAADKIIVVTRTSGEPLDKQGISLFLVDANQKGIKRKGYPTVDGHQAADIWFDNVKVSSSNIIGELGNALSIIENLIDRATLSICAEAVGAMKVITEKTVEYAKTRQQFGQSIGKFQALQHRMANMFIENQMAHSILLMAALEMDANDGVAPKALSAAKSRIGKAARLVGQEAVQIHGAIGMTDELDVGHLFKRLTTIQFTFGSTDFHTQRFASL